MMTQVDELTGMALEVLDTHAKKLETEFSTVAEFQALFLDVFGENLPSPDNLADLQNQFIDGTLRPEVKFVSPQTLTDAQGMARGAAFDHQSQTILLADNLDAAGIESSIEQEIGHWWDVQLNGNQDTTTPDGKPFDEGTAYAERFSEGANGDNIFSDLVYQNDFLTIFVDGQETEVEFRPIATWNLQGNTNSGNETLAAVLNLMENPGQGQEPIEIMALQEVSLNGLANNLRNVDGVSNVDSNAILVGDNPNILDPLIEITFEFENNNYRMFAGGNERLATAIILRNSPDEVTPISAPNPLAQNNRGYVGVETPQGYYFSVHARATGDGNDAEALLNDIVANRVPGGDLAFIQRELPAGENVFILGDFNRNIASYQYEWEEPHIRGGPWIARIIDSQPVSDDSIDSAFPDRVQGPDWSELLIPPNDFTHHARRNSATFTLDYMFTGANLPNREGTVLNQLPNARTPAFPSDHYPVLYDDGLLSFGDNPILDVIVPDGNPDDLNLRDPLTDGDGNSVPSPVDPLSPGGEIPSFGLTSVDDEETGQDSNDSLVSDGDFPDRDYIVGAYFPEWGIYARDFQVEDIPADQLTHLFYAFAQIDNNGEVAIYDPWAATDTPFLNEATGEGKYTPEQSQANEAGNFAELQKLKAENPDLNLMLSIGGWSLSGPFSTVASTEASRETFAQSAVDFMVEYGFDGLDIDWEYPGEGGASLAEVEELAPKRINKEVADSPNDGRNYTLLLAELNEQIQIQEAADGRDYQLSIASPAGFKNIENLELAAIAEHIDFFNLMAYDFHGSTWEPDTTNHQAGLFANPDDPSEAEIVEKFNIHYAVEAYLDAGIAPEDIILGAPAYGRAWTGVSSDANDGLFQSATGTATGSWEDGVLDYKDLYNRLENQPGEYGRYWDDEAKVPYVFAPGAEGGFFSTYEDSESIALKSNYIKNLGLGGMFFWDLSGDLPGSHDNSLINNAHRYLTLGEHYDYTPT